MMTHLKRRTVPLLLILCLFLLSGCAGRIGAAVFTTGPNSGSAEIAEDPPKREDPITPEPEADPAPELEPETDPVPEPGTEPDPTPEPDPGPEAGSLFETIPSAYMFCSGAGGWSTDLTVDQDGSFTGLFLDADMGVVDEEKYPYGTRYVCNFSGKFTQPVKANETVWSMRIESLELDHPDDGAEEYADGARYIYAGPYGLENAEELRIYLPDTPAKEVPEEVLRAACGPYSWQPTESGALGLTIIFNVSEGCGFVQYPLIKE